MSDVEGMIDGAAAPAGLTGCPSLGRASALLLLDFRGQILSIRPQFRDE
ncbi:MULTISPECIES: hypothetical protein [Nitratireductor]|nr:MULTISPECIES: hypothetical protein [Nitratireductor]